METNTTTAIASKKGGKKLSPAEKANQISQVWNSLAPESKFAGVSLTEFQSITNPARETREQLAILRAKQKGYLATRNAADKATCELIQAVVSGVKADPHIGSNSSVYRAMGYVTPSERKSRKSASVDAGLTATNSAHGKTHLKLMEQVDQIIKGWNQFAPETTFSGHTAAAFSDAIAPSRAARETMAEGRATIAGTMVDKMAADRVATKLINRVVSAIRADVDFGTDSAFYRALGYMTDSERGSRKRTAATAAASASTASTPTAPTTPSAAASHPSA